MASSYPVTAVQQQELEQQGEQGQQQDKWPKTLLKTDRIKVLQSKDASCTLIYRHNTHWHKLLKNATAEKALRTAQKPETMDSLLLQVLAETGAKLPAWSSSAAGGLPTSRGSSVQEVEEGIRSLVVSEEETEEEDDDEEEEEEEEEDGPSENTQQLVKPAPYSRAHFAQLQAIVDRLPAGPLKQSRQDILDECRKPVLFVDNPALEAEVERLLAMPAPVPKAQLQDGECADCDDDDSSSSSDSSGDSSEVADGGGFD